MPPQARCTAEASMGETLESLKLYLMEGGFEIYDMILDCVCVIVMVGGWVDGSGG